MPPRREHAKTLYRRQVALTCSGTRYYRGQWEVAHATSVQRNPISPELESPQLDDRATKPHIAEEGAGPHAVGLHPLPPPCIAGQIP